MTINWIPSIQDRNKPAYLAIASRIADDISGGRLRPGDPLPTQRELADRMGVALGTVTRAYAEARKRGLIHADGRRGTFIGPGPENSSTLDSLIRPAPRTIDLSINQPAYPLDPDLGQALADLGARADLNSLTRYPPPEGSERHRHAGAQWMKRLGKAMDPDRVILTSGGQNGIFLSLASICEPGDVILTEEPCYPGVKSVADTLNLTLAGVEMDDNGLLPDALAAACRRTKSRVLFCTPEMQNPTTATMDLARRRHVAAVARQYGLTVIEDLIHRPLLTCLPPLVSQMLPEDKSFVLTSISKNVACGLRVGFMSCPPGLHATVLKRKQAVDLVGAPITFEIFTAWMADGTVDRTVRRKRAEARARQEILAKELAGFDLRTQDAAYFAWLNLPESMGRARFTATAGEMGVSVVPSDVFALDPSKAAEAVRLSIITPVDRDVLAQGLKILAGILTRHPQNKPFLWV